MKELGKVAKSGKLALPGRGGRRFKSCHPDQLVLFCSGRSGPCTATVGRESKFAQSSTTASGVNTAFIEDPPEVALQRCRSGIVAPRSSKSSSALRWRSSLWTRS